MNRLGVWVSVLLMSVFVGQQEQPSSKPMLWPAAAPADVETQDAVIASLYSVISGPAGERNWDRLRSLFSKHGRLTVARRLPEGKAVVREFSVDEYIQLVRGHFEKNAFYESEIHRVSESFGHVTHMFSTYESRRSPEEKPFARGVNSIQLFSDGRRFYILSVLWDEEGEHQPIPEKYLP